MKKVAVKDVTVGQEVIGMGVVKNIKPYNKGLQFTYAEGSRKPIYVYREADLDLPLMIAEK